MDIYSCTLNMPQEIKAESFVFVGTFDQTGNVSYNDFLVIYSQHAEIRSESRKRIPCNFGVGIRNSLQKAAFACIGKTDQSNISNHFQFKFYIAFFTGFAFF